MIVGSGRAGCSTGPVWARASSALARCLGAILRCATRVLCSGLSSPRHAAVAPCVQVLGLPSDGFPASTADIRRQYKLLAALVHPDKCAWSGAGEAFASLRAAADSLLEAAEQSTEAGTGSGGPRSKRRRTDDAGGATAADDSDGGHGWVPDGGGFPWWDEWDAPVSLSRPAAAGATEAGPAERAAAGGAHATGQQRADSGTTAASGTEGQQQAQSSSEERDRDDLIGMSLDELRAEVRRRQATLLSPQVDETGRRVPLQQLQAALRRARTLLAERVAIDAAAAAAASGGGFL